MLYSRFGLLMALVLCLSLTGCARQAETIRHISDETGFSMAFSAWRGKSDQTMELAAGEELWVEIDCRAGSLSLRLRGAGGEESYEGKRLIKKTFSMKVASDDTFTLSVEGNDAEGSLLVRRMNRQGHDRYESAR